MTTDKRRIVFIGFNNDYNKLEIDSLRKYYAVENITSSRIFFSPYSLMGQNSSSVVRLFRKFISVIFYMYVKYFVCKENDYIVLSEHNDPYFLSLCSKITRDKILFFRNVVSKQMIKFTTIFKCFSFDHNDVITYKMNQYNQFASGYEHISKHTYMKDFDFVFLGRDKGREKELQALKLLLDGYKVRIEVPKPEKPIKGIFKKVLGLSSPTLSYLDYLDVQLNTIIVIDFVQKGQVGITMRTIEALVSGRKVITNNPFILNAEIYKTGNIMFFDELTSRSDICLFYQKDFSNIDEKLLDEYSPKHNIGQVINS